jgi:hypothetical protein
MKKLLFILMLIIGSVTFCSYGNDRPKTTTFEKAIQDPRLQGNVYIDGAIVLKTKEGELALVSITDGVLYHGYFQLTSEDFSILAQTNDPTKLPNYKTREFFAWADLDDVLELYERLVESYTYKQLQMEAKKELTKQNKVKSGNTTRKKKTK